MKLPSILMAVMLLAAPAMAQHDHDSHEHGQKSAASPQKMSLPTTLTEQTTCPISNEELEDKDTFLDYAGQRIYVCCNKCKKKAAKNPEVVAMGLYANGFQLENVQSIDPVTGEKLESKTHFHKLYNMRIYVNDEKDVAKVAADPAKYLDALAGRHAQEKCAVRGGDINPKANFTIEGMTIGQCCAGCEKKWKAEPSEMFAKLEKDHVVVEPATMKCPVMPGMNGSKKYPVTLGAKRYYLCSEKVAVMFSQDPSKYLPKWYAAQGITVDAAPANHEESGHGDHNHGSMQMNEGSDCDNTGAKTDGCSDSPKVIG